MAYPLEVKEYLVERSKEVEGSWKDKFETVKNEVKRKFGETLSMSSEESFRRYVQKCLSEGQSRQDESVDAVIEESRQLRKHKEASNSLKRQNESLIVKLDEKDRLIEMLSHVGSNPVRSLNIAPQFSNSEATAVLLASDFHIEERVDPRKVNGMNEYNLDIAEQRASAFFANGLRVVSLLSKDVRIRNVILAFLGDFISGYIHDELKETNELSPVMAIMRWRDMVISGIRHLLKESDFDFTIIMTDGNHGRLTKGIQAATRTDNSLEWLMYHMIAHEFVNEPRLNFVISNGENQYFKVYDYTMRFTHGDGFKFGGGVGGITIPIRKRIAQLDKIKRADVTCMGHFHSLLFHNNFVVNGSLIGWSPYAERIGADFEPPQQAFFLMEKDHGKIMQTPIFLDKY